MLRSRSKAEFRTEILAAIEYQRRPIFEPVKSEFIAVCQRVNEILWDPKRISTEDLKTIVSGILIGKVILVCLIRTPTLAFNRFCLLILGDCRLQR